MADEGGFEIARAYVTVDPDAGDFDEKLREQIGDPRATLVVDANTEEAVSAVDEVQARADDLSAEIPITANTEEADATLDGLRAKLDEMESTLSAIPVDVDGDASEKLAEIAAQLDELEAQHGQITLGTGNAEADIAALSAAVNSLQAELAAFVPEAAAGGAAIAGMAEKMAELDAASVGAASSISGMGAAAVTAAAEVDELNGSLQEVSLHNSAEMYVGVAEGMNQAGAASTVFAERAQASAQDVADLAERFNLANAELTQFEGVVTADVPALESLGGGFRSLGGDIDGFMAQGAGSVEELARLGEEMTLLETELGELEAQLGTASGAFASFGEAADAQVVSLHNSADMYAGVEAALADTEAGVAGLTAETRTGAAATRHYGGMWGALTEVLTSTPVLVGAAAVGMGILVYELSKVPSALQDTITNLRAQDGAVHDSVPGWQKFAATLQDTSNRFTGAARAGNLIGPALAHAQEAQQQYGAAAQAAAAHMAEVTLAVSQMEDRLSVTGPMAERLAYDEQQIGDKALGAKGEVAAFSNEIKLLTGNLNTNWQLTLGIQAGYDQLAADAKAAGASMTGMNQASVTMQQQFASNIAMLDQYGQHQQTAGKMTQQTADYITGQTAKLALFAGGNREAQQQVEGMIAQEQLWGAKTGDVNRVITNLSSSIQGSFVSSLKAAGENSAQVDTEMSRLSASILATGTTSASTQADRKALISDLEALGMKAGAAKAIVAKLEGEIAALHSKSISIGVHIEESVSGAGVAVPGGMSGTTLHGVAAGGAIVPGYAPGHDTKPYLLSPGEGVLVPELTRAIGPAAIMAANRAYSGGRRSTPGHMAGGGVTSAAFGFPQDVFDFVINVSGGGAGGGGAGAGGGTVSGLPVFSHLRTELAKELKPGSSQKTMESDGKTLSRAFESAYKDTASQIKTETADALRVIREYYSGPAATQLENTIKSQSKALEALATKTASVATEIASMKAYAAQETQSLQSFSNVGNIQGTTNPVTGVTAAPTGQQISAGLKQDLATLRKFFSLIGELKAKKVDASMINQVIQLGPDQGVAYAEAILAGGANLIKQINKEESQIASIEVKIGQRAADIEFGQPLALGFLHALDKEKAELEKRMKHLGDVMAKELQDALEKLKITIPVTTTGKKASAGWRVPGYGGGDRQPALLEGGETVVSKEHSQIPYMQHAFAAAGVPGYSGGGLVLETGQPYIGPRAIAPPASAASRGAVNVNYFGPQRPTPEMEAAMLRRLATAVGAAG